MAREGYEIPFFFQSRLGGQAERRSSPGMGPLLAPRPVGSEAPFGHAAAQAPLDGFDLPLQLPVPPGIPVGPQTVRRRRSPEPLSGNPRAAAHICLVFYNPPLHLLPCQLAPFTLLNPIWLSSFFT